MQNQENEKQTVHSRVLKFRAWSIEHKKMLPVHDAKFVNGLMIGAKGIGWDDTVELMQYTGLKDSKGKECWEGDIVKRIYFDKKKEKFSIDTIVYREDWGAFAFTSKTNIGEGWSRMYGGHKVFPWEIIGNIYENGDLLKN